MSDLPARLVIAYGLIALAVLAAAALVLRWWRHDIPHRRYVREKANAAALHRRQLRAAAAADDGSAQS